MDIEAFEKQKYTEIWQSCDYSAGRRRMMGILQHLKGASGTCLEIGCGNGELIMELKKTPAIVPAGLDITLAGFKYNDLECYEAPAWKMPFNNKHWDYSISTDVLEHMPTELIPETLKEINRVTKYKTIHAISTKKAVRDYCGYKVHLTVRPLSWWEEMFKKYVKIDYKLMEL